MLPVAMVVIVNLLLFSLFCLLAAFLDDFDVIIEDSGDDGNHVRLDHTGANPFGAANTYVDDTLKGEVPLPHTHHVFAATLFEYADEAFDAAIDGEDVADSGRGGGEVGKVVEGVDERQGRGTVKSPSVVQGRGDAH